MSSCVSINQVRKADIIVSKTDAAISGAIRVGSGSEFSMYVGHLIS